MTKKVYENNPFNIVGCWFSASPEEHIAGKTWYQTANDISSRIGDLVNVRNDLVQGVIAALSPNVRWERNVKDAETFLQAYKSTLGEEDWDYTQVRLSAYPLNREKAWRILTEGVLGSDKINKILNGNKTKAFFECINNPNNHHAVCVDGHARNIFYGTRVALKSKSMGDKEYHHIAAAYREAAGIISKVEGVDILPMQVQAVTWTHWRVRHGIA